jgi:hypothetical protein
MNIRNWRSETQLATIAGIAWLGWAVLLALSIGESAQGGHWVQFAVFLLCAVLLTFTFALTLWYAARHHARSSRQPRT